MPYTDPARLLPELPAYDVVVVGGGPAGIGAAFAAGRRGMKTLVIEQHNCLGGVGTAGGHGYMCTCGSHRAEGLPDLQIVGGVAWEILEKICAEGHGDLWQSRAYYDLEAMKFLLERLAADAGVDLLYHTLFCETVVVDGRAVGVVIQNKGGRQFVPARMVVDCSGDGDAAATAGCACEQGRPQDGKCQPMTLMFTLGGVDFAKVCAFRQNDYNLKTVWAAAQAAGDMEPFQSQIMGWWWNSSRPDFVDANFTHITGVDSTRAEDLTRATIEGRRQAWHMIDVYRKYVPGMEGCFLARTGATVGIRESRRIIGGHVLTEAEIMQQTRFADAVAFGSFFIDIHSLDGPGMDGQTWRPGPDFRYQIPYRCIVPATVDNLLVAGRCISTTHVALGSTRVMSQCTALGEAAGTAASLAVRDGIVARHVPVDELQAALRSAGGIVTDDDVCEFAPGIPRQGLADWYRVAMR